MHHFRQSFSDELTICGYQLEPTQTIYALLVNISRHLLRSWCVKC